MHNFLMHNVFNDSTNEINIMSALAYRTLVKNAIAKGFTVSVWDGEEWQVKRSNKLEEICDAIKSVEEAQLRIYDADQKIGWAQVSAYGLAPDETVIDSTDSEIMNEMLGE